MFETDRNRDMEADWEKWNAEGGLSPDAETSVQQTFGQFDRKDKVVDIDYRLGPGVPRESAEFRIQFRSKSA